MRSLKDQTMVLATRNRGKINEILTLLKGVHVDIILVSNLGLSEPRETEDTLEGNARLKATYTASQTGMIALADDSGLEVAALGNQPGVATADWAERHGGRDYRFAMRRIWQALETQRAPLPRRARFRSVICVAWIDGETATFEGVVNGHVVWPPRGANGFGYDPIFVPDEDTRTFGEMTEKEKSKHSHRSRSLQLFMQHCLNNDAPTAA